MTVLKKNWVLYSAVSLLLLAPCYWQPRLQAGDLSGLIYNGWISALLESGRAQGLMSVGRWTNMLFDWILRGMFQLFGPEPAQRITISLAVLIFAWGAFAFVSAVSGKRCWHLMPSIAMLAYGWVFHMGFFDFYLSLGFCFWAMAICWIGTRARLAASVPLFVLAYLAHALPVIWSLGIVIYVVIARPLEPKRRALLTANFILFMLVCHLLVGRVLSSNWLSGQTTSALTTMSNPPFGSKYLMVLLGQTLVWSMLFVGLIRNSGARQVVMSIPFLVCVVGATAILALPATLLFPNFYQGLGFVTERMSLGVAVCVCGLLGAVRPRMLDRWALVIVPLVFFVLVYQDQRATNRMDDPLQDVVSTVN